MIRSVRHFVERALAAASGRARDLSNRWQGVRYRLLARVPNPTVPDGVLADRIRSTLGPLEHRRDMPRVHVTVQDRIATLHGNVPSVADADAVEEATLAIPGVRGVESYLGIGLLSGDSRPSEGRAHPAPSRAWRRLVQAARDAGAGEGDDAVVAVRAVLSAFAARLPPGERDHVLHHLPGDVAVLVVPTRRFGHTARVRTVSELVAAVGARGAAPEHVAAVTESVLGALRELVPEEVADVAAVLPGELRELWEKAVPA